MSKGSPRITIDGVEYTWVGGFGAILRSVERGRKYGDVRMIDGTLYYVYIISKRGWCSAPEISWTIRDPTTEKITEIKTKLFGRY